MDALQQADRHQEYYQRTAAKTHERQRDPGDGHDADGHPDVHEHLESEDPGDPGCDQTTVHVFGQPRHAKRPPDDDSKQSYQQDGAHKSQLLPNDREDEVGMVRRQEVQMGLRALQVSLAREHAAAHGDLALGQLVAQAGRVSSADRGTG